MDAKCRDVYDEENDVLVLEELIPMDRLTSDFKTVPKQFSGAAFNLLVRKGRDNNTNKFPCLGLYVCLYEPWKLPPTWRKFISFQIALVNSDDKKTVYRSLDEYQFTAVKDPETLMDQGYSNFLSLAEGVDFSHLTNPSYGFCNKNREIKFRVRIEIIPSKTIPGPYQESKKRTGMVGLENLGATCYLNALLEVLYHVTAFRKAVYDIPLAIPAPSIDSSTTLALQSVFYGLQTKDHEVDTRDLTRAFGWTSTDAFMQQDVQEMMRVLLDKLEEKMAKTKVDGVIKQLFAGKVQSYVRCVNVEYRSTRVEDFYDIQLDVKGCKNVRESFVQYVAKEMLNGDNKYDAGEQHGKQDAEKGVSFLKFPPVLTIHLKRFAFDLQRMGFAKVHDRYEFPVLLDLNDFVSEDAEPEDKAINHTYELQSVLVHAGDVYGGHYYVYIRPANYHQYGKENPAANAGKWFMFNDENVYEVPKKEAVELCFGRAPGSHTDRMASAYMLVYVRVDAGAKCLFPIHGEECVPAELSNRLVSQKAKEMHERHHDIISAQFTEMYYWLEADVALFSQYYPQGSGGDFLSHRTCRKMIIPKGSTYIGIWLKLLKLLNVEPWQLFIFPYNLNAVGHTSSQLGLHARKLSLPIRGLEDPDWFFTNGKMVEYCRALNCIPDKSYVYVHVTKQFDNLLTSDIKLSIKQKLAEILSEEKYLIDRAVKLCNEKGIYADDALNLRPVNSEYGLGLGMTFWPLNLVKQEEKFVKECEMLVRAVNDAQKKLVFEGVFNVVAPLTSGTKLLFFKIFNPADDIKRSGMHKGLLDKHNWKIGRIAVDVFDQVSLSLDNAPKIVEKDQVDRAFLENIVDRTYQEQYSDYMNPNNPIAYLGSKFCDCLKPIRSFKDVCCGFLQSNLPLNLYCLSFPNAYVLYSEDTDEIDCCHDAGKDSLTALDEILIEHYSLFSQAQPYTSVVYCERYNQNIPIRGEIVRLEGVHNSEISVLSYLSVLFFTRLVNLKPDDGIRPFLLKLLKSNSRSKKRYRSARDIQAIVEELDYTKLSGSPLTSISEDSSNEEEEDLLDFTIKNLSINTNLPLKLIFPILAESIGHGIDPHNLMVVPACATATPFSGISERGAFGNCEFGGISLPPIVMLGSDETLYSILSKRKMRKFDTIIYRLTPFSTCDQSGALTLLGFGVRQFDILISDKRLVNIRKQFLILLTLYQQQQKMLSEDSNGTSADNINICAGSKRHKGEEIDTNMKDRNCMSGKVPGNKAKNNLGDATMCIDENATGNFTSNLSVDSVFVEDPLGFLWPISDTLNIRDEFVFVDQIFTCSSQNSTISELSLNLRNLLGIPIHSAFLGLNCSDGRVARIRGEQFDSIASEPEAFCFQWLQSIEEWLVDWRSTYEMLGGFNSNLIQAQESKIVTKQSERHFLAKLFREFVLACRLLFISYDNAGHVTNIYYSSSSIDKLNYCWLDISQDVVYANESSNVAVQFFSEIEDSVWRTDNPKFKSLGIIIEYVQNHGKEWFQGRGNTPCDPALYGAPLLTYLTENCKWECFLKRVCGMIGVSAYDICGESDVLIALSLEKSVLYLPGLTRGSSFNFPLKLKQAADSGDEISKYTLSLTPNMKVWELLSRISAERTCSLTERKKNKKPTIAAFFPFTLLVERPAVDFGVASVANRIKKVSSSIKIQ